jgi:hypothetical protein
MMRLFRTAAIALIVLASAHAANAQLSGRDRDEIKKMTKGDLYLRNNLPVRYTSGGWGIGAEVVTEVSPTGVDWEKNLALIAEKRLKAGVDAIYWGFGPNDLIHYGKMYFKGGDVLEFFVEGAKPKDTEIWIRFVQIKNLDDFKKAFNLILSPQPLQAEHPEWPEEIEGMTKAQAFCVVGTPLGAEVSEKDGKKTETWFPRQETGAAGSYGKVVSSETGFPVSLQFVDGTLASITNRSKAAKVDLK